MELTGHNDMVLLKVLINFTNSPQKKCSNIQPELHYKLADSYLKCLVDLQLLSNINKHTQSMQLKITVEKSVYKSLKNKTCTRASAC